MRESDSAGKVESMILYKRDKRLSGAAGRCLFSFAVWTVERAQNGA